MTDAAPKLKWWEQVIAVPFLLGFLPGFVFGLFVEPFRQGMCCAREIIKTMAGVMGDD